MLIYNAFLSQSASSIGICAGRVYGLE